MLLVTGITGHTGRYFLQELIDNEYRGRIRSIVRAKSDTSMLDSSGLDIEKVYGDLNDKTTIANAMSDVEDIIHIYNIHHSPYIVESAINNHVSRAVLVHTTGVYSRFKYASQGYRDVEERVLDLTSSPSCPTKITILRPTMIYGDMCDSNMSKFIRLIDKLRVVPVIDGGKSCIQPINARDLAKALYAVLANPEKTAGKEYNLSGERPLQIIDAFRLISDNLNKKTTFVNVPLGCAVLGARLAKLFTLGRIDYVERVHRMGEDRSCSHANARDDFCFSPMRFDEGIKTEVEEYLSR